MDSSDRTVSEKERAEGKRMIDELFDANRTCVQSIRYMSMKGTDEKEFLEKVQSRYEEVFGIKQ